MKFLLSLALLSSCVVFTACLKPEYRTPQHASKPEGADDEPEPSDDDGSDLDSTGSDDSNTVPIKKPNTVPMPSPPSGDPAPSPTPVPSTPKDPDALLSVAVSGRQLLVDGKPFIMKAVCYNPVPKGKGELSGTLFSNPGAAELRDLEADFKLMTAAGINTIRTYSLIENAAVLALLNKYGLFVIVPVMNGSNVPDSEVKRIVSKLKNHRSTLFWAIGNEWNYNSLYNVLSNPTAAQATVKRAVTLVKSLDASHPVSTVYGDLPSRAIVEDLREVDLWGLNVYAGKTFGDRIARFKEMSTKPMYFGEFGADAFNANTMRVDEQSQGVATEALLKEIRDNLSATSASHAVLGGAIFEWSDEWWKDNRGTQATHDTGGTAPGGGPYPDSVFNEEWWGVVDIDRNPRPAYQIMKTYWKN